MVWHYATPHLGFERFDRACMNMYGRTVHVSAFRIRGYARRHRLGPIYGLPTDRDDHSSFVWALVASATGDFTIASRPKSWFGRANRLSSCGHASDVSSPPQNR